MTTEQKKTLFMHQLNLVKEVSGDPKTGMPRLIGGHGDPYGIAVADVWAELNRRSALCEAVSPANRVKSLLGSGR